MSFFHQFSFHFPTRCHSFNTTISYFLFFHPQDVVPATLPCPFSFLFYLLPTRCCFLFFHPQNVVLATLPFPLFFSFTPTKCRSCNTNMSILFSFFPYTHKMLFSFLSPTTCHSFNTTISIFLFFHPQDVVLSTHISSSFSSHKYIYEICSQQTIIFPKLINAST